MADTPVLLAQAGGPPNSDLASSDNIGQFISEFFSYLKVSDPYIQWAIVTFAGIGLLSIIIGRMIIKYKKESRGSDRIPEVVPPVAMPPVPPPETRPMCSMDSAVLAQALDEMATILNDFRDITSRHETLLKELGDRSIATSKDLEVLLKTSSETHTMVHGMVYKKRDDN